MLSLEQFVCNYLSELTIPVGNPKNAFLLQGALAGTR